MAKIKKSKKQKAYLFLNAGILALVLIATFCTPTGRNSSLEEKLGILSGLIFVFSAYLRMYYIYKLEQLKGEHGHQSFVDFFNHFFVEFRLYLIFWQVPYLKKYNSELLEKYRKLINLATLLVYCTFMTFGYLVLKINNH
jgi:hypothetical protein